MELEIEDSSSKQQFARNVPWMSSSEWNFVRENLFSKDQEIQREAFHRVTCWQARVGSKSPVGLVCTLSLMEAKLADVENGDPSNIVHVYSLALLRCIGLIMDSVQTGLLNAPMHLLARKIGIPQWIIDLRHEATHSTTVPSLCLVRAGAEFLVGWLKKRFWDTLSPCMSDSKGNKRYDLIDGYDLIDVHAEEDITALIVKFQQSQYQIILSKEKSSQKAILAKLRKRLGTQDARNTLISVLVRDGFLVPTTKQISALQMTSNALNRKGAGPATLNRRLQHFWRPVLYVAHNEGLTSRLVLSLVECLCGMTEDRGDEVADFLLGWIHAIANAMPPPDGSRCKNNTLSSGLAKPVPDQDWSSVYVACVGDHNKYTLSALEILLDTVGKNLSQSTKGQLLDLIRPNERPEEAVIPPEEIPMDEEPAVPLLETPAPAIPLETPAPPIRLEDVDHLRGRHCDPWSLASDAVRWDRYPIGRLPGQSDDPRYLYLDCEREVEDSGHTGTPGAEDSGHTGTPGAFGPEETSIEHGMSDADGDRDLVEIISSYFPPDASRDEGRGSPRTDPSPQPLQGSVSWL